jgi:AcrR family transcriptional regulator
MPDPAAAPTNVLRADARRNQHRILDAARSAIEESAAGFAVDDVARRAEVGIATIYRRFAGRKGLVRAVLEQYFVDEIEPLVTASLTEPDPWTGLVRGLEATLVTVVANTQLLAAAQDAGVITADLTARYLEPLGTLLRRAQDSGAARPDLLVDDLPALVTMAVSTVRLTPDRSGAWRRYLALLLDGSRAASSSGGLPGL